MSVTYDPERDPALQHVPPGQRAAAREQAEKSRRVQNTQELLANLLPMILGQSYDEFDPVAATEDGQIILTI